MARSKFLHGNLGQKMSPSNPNGTLLVTPKACTSEILVQKVSALFNFQRWDESSGIVTHDLGSVTGIWVRQDTVVNRAVLEGFPNLKFVASTTTSVVHIDKYALAARGVALINLVSGDTGLNSITSTVDHTWALIFHVHGKVAQALKCVRGGRWDNSELIRKYQLSSLALGIIGAGRIGFQVAQVGQAFGMRVNIYDPSERAQDAANSAGMLVFQSMQELFENSNYVSIHATGSDENFAMVDNRILESASGVHIFNTARGELVDETAVVACLQNGQLSGYHTDVLISENNGESIEDSPIYKGFQSGLPITLTPHIGGSSLDSMMMAEEIICRKIERLMLREGHGPIK